MRHACYFAAILFVVVCGALSCTHKLEVQSAPQTFTTRPTPTATEVGSETLTRHDANLTIERDERGHVVGMFDVESYFDDPQLCEIKQDVVKLADIRKDGAVVTDLGFQMASTARFYVKLDDRLRQMFDEERNEFERFFAKGRKFRVVVHECFAPCQNSRDLINIEPL